MLLWFLLTSFVMIEAIYLKALIKAKKEAADLKGT